MEIPGSVTSPPLYMLMYRIWEYKKFCYEMLPVSKDTIILKRPRTLNHDVQTSILVRRKTEYSEASHELVFRLY